MIIVAFACTLVLIVYGVYRLANRGAGGAKGHARSLTLFDAAQLVVFQSVASGLAAMSVAWTLVFGLNINNSLAENPQAVEGLSKNLAALTPPLTLAGVHFSFEVSPTEMAVSLFVVAVVTLFKTLKDYENCIVSERPRHDERHGDIS